ncbi:hypothetical protein HNQ81_000394 [Desulfoprunum benzoelyticum]|uniref:Uncharacterized protein n=1 Tax=Desulfoprunum benzoelyticum TaxID=1506996 RepID=A0A840UK19_9BACT|nr:hypothetical protein [Desulfoprunum benzoelyticum]
MATRIDHGREEEGLQPNFLRSGWALRATHLFA